MFKVHFMPLLVSLVITVHIFPLLAWCSIDLFGHLDQTDLLEVILGEEPAGADRRCLGFSFLSCHALKLLCLINNKKQT